MLMCLQGCLKAAKWLHKRNPLVINILMEKELRRGETGMKMLPHDLCVMVGHAKMAKWIRKQGGKSNSKSLETIARGPPSLSQDLDHGYSKRDNEKMTEFHSVTTKVRASILKKLEQKACTFEGTACGKIGAKLKCSLCSSAVNETRYCNATCQKNHWPEHKLGECGVLAKKLKKEKKKKKKKKFLKN